MGKITQAARDAGAFELHETSIKGLFFRPLGYGDLNRFDEAKLRSKEGSDEFVEYVILDLLKDEDGNPACDGPEELVTIPPSVVLGLVGEAGEYFRGNVPEPPKSARPKRTRKRT